MSAPAMIGVIAGAVAVGVAAISLTSAVEANHRVESAAQNVALAAADAYFGWRGGEPCALADTVATHNNTTLLTCELRELDVLVSVRVRTILGERISTARAGLDDVH